MSSKKVCDDCYIFHLPEHHNPYRQIQVPEAPAALSPQLRPKPAIGTDAKLAHPTPDERKELDR